MNDDIIPYYLIYGGAKKKQKKWSTFVHNGVLFPPPYQPHNIPVIYQGSQIVLPPLAEELATIYTRYLDTEYVSSGRFNRNFWSSWKHLVKEHNITSLSDCDFSLIKQYLLEQKMKKMDKSPETKKMDAQKKEAVLKHFKDVHVDGREEHVGNFMIEPNGIFLGRGCHPKLGTVKGRINPEDVTINLGKDAPVPKIYYLSADNQLVEMTDKKWGNVIHDNKVEWVASWKDPIMNKKKYVWLADHSSFKSASDIKKFDLARKLKKKIGKIRDHNIKLYKSNDRQEMQLATATYLIDKLALRVGNEKGEDKADTVGLTSLRVEHITFEGSDTITLDFLGKDSMRYYNTVQVEPIIYANLYSMTRNKHDYDPIFDQVSASDLNEYLQSLMKGLTAKVFRTFNASNIFQHKLNKIKRKYPKGTELTDIQIKEIMDVYDRTSIEVAKYCNHRKKVVKSLKSQMQKIKDKIEEYRKEKKKLQAKKKRTKTIAKRIAKYNAKIKLLKAKLILKNEIKDISLTTSKVNYIDPRVIYSFSKHFNIPLEKLYSKALIKKFSWADSVDENYRF